MVSNVDSTFNTQAVLRLKKERNKINQRNYRERHKEKSLENTRSYYQKNRDKILDKKKIYFQKFKESGYSEQRRLYQRVNCRYRRLANKCANPLTIEEWLEILIYCGGKCVRCGSKEDLTMDHIVPIVKGGLHTKSNIQVLCRSCNSSKGQKL